MITFIIQFIIGWCLFKYVYNQWIRLCTIEGRLSKIEDRLNMKETDHLLELDSLEDSDEDYFKDGA